MPITLREATPADWPAIAALLGDNHLPTEGFRESVGAAVVACDGPAIVGVAGLELYRDGALLRSVAVAAHVRGQGLGQRLTQHALTAARAHAMPAVYLLTTTAEHFFPRLGFVPIDRGSVPESVQQSVEFRGACPASAVAMSRQIHHIE